MNDEYEYGWHLTNSNNKFCTNSHFFHASFGLLDRASQIHGVPRKTLRNWMKRWHIKSIYPMPYQLKRAAEKKRQIVQSTETQTSTNFNTN